MGLRFFVVSVMNPEASEQELNGFLASHKVVSSERKFINEGVNSFCAICIDYLSHSPGDGISRSNHSRSRIDYKAILPPEEFTVYSQLRDKRKELAQTEAVPVYALFTNEQPAQMVQRRMTRRPNTGLVKGLAHTSWARRSVRKDCQFAGSVHDNLCSSLVPQLALGVSTNCSLQAKVDPPWISF